MEKKDIKCVQFSKEGLLNPVKAEDCAAVNKIAAIVKEKHWILHRDIKANLPSMQDATDESSRV